LDFKGQNLGNSKNGATISCSNCKSIDISKSLFEDLKAQEGSAIYITETDQTKST
jgi:hypothetical protein